MYSLKLSKSILLHTMLKGGGGGSDGVGRDGGRREIWREGRGIERGKRE